MHIVYNIAGTRHSGGMERVLANKANWLVAHGHRVTIVTTDQCGEQPFFALDSRIECHDLAIGYEANNGASFLNKLVHYPFKQRLHRRRLTELLMRLKADVVVSMFCNDASFLPDIKDGSRKVLEIHFSRFKRLQYGRKGLFALADRWRSRSDIGVVSRFDRFVVLTHEDRGYWGDLANICVIPNARTFTADAPASLDHPMVLASGRYCHQKHLDALIDAWAMVCREMSGWMLRIVGDGEDREALEEQIRSLGLTDSVRLGKVPAAEMRQAYLDASVFALTSRYEGLPMVLLEAQAVGLPIVSYACKCGPRDLIEDGVNGILVEEGDVRAMADGLLRLMRDTDLRRRMGAQAYKDSERYTEEKVMATWETLFNEICGQ
ncbi:MAG: glycosyltransferase family 4 protein [Bacteroidaceae bacterium]|nr:glycosyltransferase family 4 protein [Bacteroidaceae bacterium]